MSVVKAIEVIGTSEKGWEDAVKQAVQRTSQTLENVNGVEVGAMTAKVTGAEVTEYRATMKIAFRVNGD